MEDFRTIYKILHILQQSMDCEEIDASALSPESLQLSEPKWSRIMTMLLKEGYIEGGEMWNSMGSGYPRVVLAIPEITLKGLEYLEDNLLMKKAASLAK